MDVLKRISGSFFMLLRSGQEIDNGEEKELKILFQCILVKNWKGICSLFSVVTLKYCELRLAVFEESAVKLITYWFI